MIEHTLMTEADAAQQAIQVLLGVLGTDAVFIASYQGDHLTVEHVRSLQPGLVVEGASLSFLHAPCWHVQPRGLPLVVSDASQARPEGFFSLSPGIHACLAVPIRLPNGQAWGLLCAANSRPYDFHPEQIAVCESLAAAVGYELSFQRVGAQPGSSAGRLDGYQRTQLITDMSAALSTGEFRLVYQPIICLGTGMVKSVEALIRWDHPTMGPISPAEFIPLAEETGLINPIGEWILGEACRERQRWASQLPGPFGVQVSVNLSARQIQQPDMAPLIAQIMGETGIASAHLRLEVTESALFTNVQQAIYTMHLLKAVGVSLALDDFGTGYSSLDYLKQFPVDYLKVDRTFVAGLGTRSRDEAIVRSVIHMARTLGITTVGEGVETADQAAQLRHIGCDHGQGFYFARPLTGAQCADFLRRAAVA